MTARFYRVAETHRRPVRITVDGTQLTALEGDTLMVALLTVQGHLRHSEFGPETRAGFCLMGACQDCWVWSTGGERLRACTTRVEDGLRIHTSAPKLFADAPP